jgi:hypothetical protein
MLSEYESPTDATTLLRYGRRDRESHPPKGSCTVRRLSLARQRQLDKDGCEFYRVVFDARATNSSSLESKSFRTGDWFAFL